MMEKEIQPPLPEISPEISQAFMELMNVCTQLIIKVACCNCKNKDKCEVYLKSQEIARIIDKITELRSKLPVKGA